MAEDSPRYDLSNPATVPFSVGKLFMLDSNTAVSKKELPLAARAMRHPVRYIGGFPRNPRVVPRSVA